jgi:hypothetical protein
MDGFKKYNIRLEMENAIVVKMIRMNVFSHPRITYIYPRFQISENRECKFFSESDPASTIWKEQREDFSQGSWYLCNERKEIINPSNQILFAIESTTSIFSLTSLGIYLVEEFIDENGDPLCGTPDIPYGVFNNVIKENFEYKMNCGERFLHLNDSKNTNHTMKCNFGSKWTGDEPVCYPQKRCSNLEKENNLLDVVSYELVYYQDQSTHFAIENTKANVICKNEADATNFSNTMTCLSNEQWNNSCPRKGKLLKDLCRIKIQNKQEK